MAQPEKRIDFRFDKIFQVVIEHEWFGKISGIGRNISSGGLCVEVIDPPPLGSLVTVSFVSPWDRGNLTVRAEVKHHFSVNYNNRQGEPAWARGIGLRFIEFFEHTSRPVQAAAH